ncbi:MAG: hypothetical protein WC841_04410 [Candidatus Shapirobacteria bacterium]|jgi:hypothetical protein
MGKNDETPIKITERDIQVETLVCVDLERNIWIRRGFPMNRETRSVDREVMRNLSGPPYVFKADVMSLYDEKHPEGVILENVQVIFMHGGREEGGKWQFSSIEDGYPVVETVRAVNKYLEDKGEPPVQVVMACNRSSSPEGIKIGDFRPDEKIIYAVGETVGLRTAGMSEDGKIHFSAKASDFWGLDQLALSQEIDIL